MKQDLSDEAEIYVVVAEHDHPDRSASSGFVLETLLSNCTLRAAEKQRARLGTSLGSTRVAKLTWVDTALALVWEQEEPGLWSAPSRHHDEGSPFYYRISVNKVGHFRVQETCPEIMTNANRHKSFASLLQAKDHCQEIENQPT